jgi:ADP-dependent NAD(P)H-hydrate dehydratase / NAD(P)H-hydrate epimerase
VQADRVKAARMLAENLNAHVVLKGAGSILVARDGHWFVNRTGHSGLASAGTGDVLAGMLGALLAQGYSGEAALVLGPHLHGAAAEELARVGVGPVGTTASELIDSARGVWNTWIR